MFRRTQSSPQPTSSTAYSPLRVDIRDGVLEDWPRPRGQNFVALASNTSGLGLGLDHVVLEHIPGRYALNNTQNSQLLAVTQ